MILGILDAKIRLFAEFYKYICIFEKKVVTLQPKVAKVTINRNKTMEQKAFQQYSDAEFRDALIATMNLKQEWMASVDKREKELGLR